MSPTEEVIDLNDAIDRLGNTALEIKKERDDLHRWQSEAVELLLDLAEHFDGEADAEYFTDHAGPVPNDAMRYLMQCKALLLDAGIND